jgi:hypothetical protein
MVESVIKRATAARKSLVRREIATVKSGLWSLGTLAAMTCAGQGEGGGYSREGALVGS